MLLKSSSTPLLGSLLPSFSDSPSNHTPNHIHGKISCTNQSFRKPIFHSPSPAESSKPSTGFRRVQSEGNLEGLANDIDEFALPKKPARRTSCCTLQAIPSFSLGRLEDEDSDEDEESDFVYNQSRVENLVSERVGKTNTRDCPGLKFEDEGKMYLGIGVSGISYGGSGGGGGGSYRPVAFDRDGGGDIGMEEYYKRMLEKNPGDSLFLRNYARFLYEKKRDLEGAEEYYSRAILSDPTDGEILSQYAQLIWELHHDKERATNYFKRAVQASSEDSHIHAAYASFLWDTEDDNDNDEDDDEGKGLGKMTVGQQLFRHGFMASATA